MAATSHWVSQQTLLDQKGDHTYLSWGDSMVLYPLSGMSSVALSWSKGEAVEFFQQHCSELRELAVFSSSRGFFLHRETRRVSLCLFLAGFLVNWGKKLFLGLWLLILLELFSFSPVWNPQMLPGLPHQPRGQLQIPERAEPHLQNGFPIYQPFSAARGFII